MVRWLPGGHETFGGFLNSLVHIFMYGYYFLAALGPSMKKYLWWKKYLTLFQMVQFVVVFVRSIIVIFGVVDCGYPRYFSLISASITVLFFAMFMQFYSQSYQAKGKLKKKINWFWHCRNLRTYLDYWSLFENVSYTQGLVIEAKNLPLMRIPVMGEILNICVKCSLTWLTLE